MNPRTVARGTLVVMTAHGRRPGGTGGDMNILVVLACPGSRIAMREAPEHKPSFTTLIASIPRALSCSRGWESDWNFRQSAQLGRPIFSDPMGFLGKLGLRSRAFCLTSSLFLFENAFSDISHLVLPGIPIMILVVTFRSIIYPTITEVSKFQSPMNGSRFFAVSPL